MEISMKRTPEHTDPRKISISATRLSLTASFAALVSLAGLHALSPEFDPARRAVSEYAFGRYGWVLSLMFVAWGLSAWTLAFAIRSQIKTIGGQVGWVFLVSVGPWPRYLM
jgi:hypothetical protein